MINPVFARNPKEAERLSAKHLAIIGCGSGGSALADMAARSGVGRLTLVDPEPLVTANVGRHMLDRRDLGKPKAEALREKLLAVNPQCKVEAHQARFNPGLFHEVVLPPVHFDSCNKGFELSGPPLQYVGSGTTIQPNPNGRPDLVASCADSYACESLINAYSLQENLPAVYGGCWGEASVGEILYVVPGKTPCYECYAGFRRDVEIPADARKYTDPDFDSTRVPGQAGLWANILIISGVMFQVVLGLLDQRTDRTRFIDNAHTLFLVNVSNFHANLQPLAVTFGRVRKGCTVCDESKLTELGRNLRSCPEPRP
jgi:molybdopterin/thiamine biosynthesis adenylyltransferase